MPEKEAVFRERLAKILSRMPYGHEVYFHEGSYSKKFNMKNSNGYVDLYVKTNPLWEYHCKFPAIAIETKIAKRTGWLIDAMYQVERYDEDLRDAEYYIAGKRVIPPELFLVCTNDSFESGYLYCWNLPTLQNGEQREGGWICVTELFDRLLYRVGAAVLRKGIFYTNYKSKSGAVQRYSLECA